MLPYAFSPTKHIQTWSCTLSFAALASVCSACTLNQKSALSTESAPVVQNLAMQADTAASLKILYETTAGGRARAGQLPVTDLDDTVPRFVLVDQKSNQPLGETIQALITLQSLRRDAEEPLFWFSLETTDDGPSDALGQDLSLETLVWLRSWHADSGVIRYRHVRQSVDESQPLSFFQGKALLPVPGAVVEEELALIESLYPETMPDRSGEAGKGGQTPTVTAGGTTPEAPKAYSPRPRVQFLNPATGGALHFVSWLKGFGPVDLMEEGSTKKESLETDSAEAEDSPTATQLFYRLHPMRKRMRTAEGVTFPVSVIGYRRDDGSFSESNPDDDALSSDHQIMLLRTESAFRSASWVNPSYKSADPYQGYLLAQSLAGSPESLDDDDVFPETIEGLSPFRLTRVSPKKSVTSPVGKSKARVAVVSDRPAGTGNDLNDMISRALWAEGRADSAQQSPARAQLFLAGIRAYAYTASRLLRITRTLSARGFCHNNLRLSALEFVTEGEGLQLQLSGFGEMSKVGEFPRTPGRLLSDALPVHQRMACKPGSDLVSWALLNTQLLFEDTGGSRFLGSPNEGATSLRSLKDREASDLEELYRRYELGVSARYSALEQRVATTDALSPDEKNEAAQILNVFKSTVLDLLRDVKQQSTDLYGSTDSLLKAEADALEAKYGGSIADLQKQLSNRIP